MSEYFVSILYSDKEFIMHVKNVKNVILEINYYWSEET